MSAGRGLAIRHLVRRWGSSSRRVIRRDSACRIINDMRFKLAEDWHTRVLLLVHVSSRKGRILGRSRPRANQDAYGEQESAIYIRYSEIFCIQERYPQQAIDRLHGRRRRKVRGRKEEDLCKVGPPEKKGANRRRPHLRVPAGRAGRSRSSAPANFSLVWSRRKENVAPKCLRPRPMGHPIPSWRLCFPERLSLKDCWVLIRSMC